MRYLFAFLLVATPVMAEEPSEQAFSVANINLYAQSMKVRMDKLERRLVELTRFIEMQGLTVPPREEND